MDNQNNIHRHFTQGLLSSNKSVLDITSSSPIQFYPQRINYRRSLTAVISYQSLTCPHRYIILFCLQLEDNMNFLLSLQQPVTWHI